VQNLNRVVCCQLARPEAHTLPADIKAAAPLFKGSPTCCPLIRMAGLKTIIVLSFILAIGFLLVILSSALWRNYLPLLVVATYILAPLPNWICGQCANPDDFMESAGSAIIDFGRFMTGFLVLMGIALPAVLAHSGAIEASAMIMSILGGLLIYGTIISFTMFFREQEDF